MIIELMIVKTPHILPMAHGLGLACWNN